MTIGLQKCRLSLCYQWLKGVTMQNCNNFFDSNEFLFLHDISDELSSSLNLQDSVSQIFEMLNSRFGFAKAVLTLMTSKTKAMRINVSFGISPKEMESEVFKRWEDIMMQVLESETPLVIPHLNEGFSSLKSPDIEVMTKDSLICVPLVLGKEKFGVLSVDLPFESSDMLDNVTKLLGIVALMIAQEVRLKRLLDQEKEVLRQENVKLRKELRDKYQIDNMVGNSGAMMDVYDNIKQVAPSSATVLIRGESGTGKELVAHAIHHLGGNSEGPFIKINCGALPDTLIESELFGYEKGAFTDAVETKIGKFEAANGGTIFLDEVAELAPQLQVKLLRVLQDKEITRVGGVSPIKVSVRVVAATNRDLEQDLKEGKFREDLYYRLNVFPIVLPSLRERRSDIILLGEHFLEKYTLENNKKIVRLSASVIDTLYSYNWPGNVRELENCMERSVIVCNSDTIQHSHLPPSLHRADMDVMAGVSTKSSLKDLVFDFEKKIILDALSDVNGNVSKAARKLSTTTRILGYKIKQLNIVVQDIKSSCFV